MGTSPFIPKGAPVTFERVDQGIDFKTTPGGPIVAPWPGTVSIAPPNPGGFGTHYALYHVTGGPFKGRTFYIGHALAQRTGPVKPGDVISITGKGSESWMGNAKGIPGHTEIGLWPPGSMSAGAAVKGIVLGGGGTALSASGSGQLQDQLAGPLGDVVGDPLGGIQDFLSDPAKAIVESALGPIEQNAVRMLLYAVLVLGGILVIAVGAMRAFGAKRDQPATVAVPVKPKGAPVAAA